VLVWGGIREQFVLRVEGAVADMLRMLYSSRFVVPRAQYRVDRGPTLSGLNGFIHPMGMPIAVSRMTCTVNCSASSRIGASRLLRAVFEIRVLHIAQEEWNRMVNATLSRGGGAGSSTAILVIDAIAAGEAARVMSEEGD